MNGLGVILFVVFALVSIGIHELGHFSTAKWFGIKVDRFFIGFGPRLWSITRGETEYGIAALPLGGYVRIAGMNPFEEVPPEERDRVFRAKKPWQRAIVLAAGSFTHFVIAFVILVSIFALVAQPDFDRPTQTVLFVSEGEPGKPSPAQQAGIREGDRIVSVDGVRAERWQDVVALVTARPGQRVEIGIVRDGLDLTVPVTLAENKPGETERTGFLGVSPDFVRVKESLGSAVIRSGRDIGVASKDSLVAFKNIFSPSTLSRIFRTITGEEQRRPEDPTTIVGIGRGAGDLAGRGDFAGLFFLLAGFNIFIGVANLLPLLPLDGGHLAVLGFEKITRREVDMRKLIPVSALVVSVFATLFFLLLYLDIVSPIPTVG